MTKTALEKLDRAVKAVRELPEEAQEAIAHELMERVSEFSRSHLSDEQREEVRRRLSKPRRYASDDEVKAVLRRYNPAL